MKYRGLWSVVLSALLIACFLSFGCDPAEFFEYLVSEDTERVDDRFHESRSGNTKPIADLGIGTEEFIFLWTSDIHIAEGEPHYMKRFGRYANAKGAAFIAHSGDVADEGLEDEYEKWLRLLEEHFDMPMFTALGNHDLYNDGWDEFKKLIGPSVFDFEYGVGDGYSHFIFIDTGNATLGKDQMDWLERTLKNSHAKHKFVFSHFPVYDGELTTPTLISDPEERYKLLGLFQRYDVDFYLSGHKHSGEKYNVEGVWTIIGGAGSAWKDIIYKDPHFYRFHIKGKEIDFKLVYFDDI